MNFARIIHTLPSEIKNLYRKIEKNENKLLKNKWFLIFNETCLKEEILPNYTKIILSSQKEMFRKFLANIISMLQSVPLFSYLLKDLKSLRSFSKN